MRVISRRTLRQFWEDHPDAEQAVHAWFREAQQARWGGPADINARYAGASFLPRDRVVFNIRGNSYRLIVAIKYAAGIVFLRFVGTHSDYDRVDASKV
ncbi:MAG: type II toxin-antitoxin system HigB family toxin [Deltaproteobacteria bacterium]|nr:type II toxin-antitoxin system HigB family toxin [Deltaproteobacteria bacterium]